MELQISVSKYLVNLKTKLSVEMFFIPLLSSSSVFIRHRIFIAAQPIWGGRFWCRLGCLAVCLARRPFGLLSVCLHFVSRADLVDGFL